MALWFVITLGTIAWLANGQRDNRRLIEERFTQRALITSGFVGTYVEDVVARERRQAQAHLSSPAVPASEFERVVTDEGFGAAVLLDEGGRLLRVHPHDPSLIGADLGAKYAHLAGALEGRVTVSDVVPSAVRGRPIVAFAVPFEGPDGTRVYSGAEDIGATAAGDYLQSSVNLPRTRLFLLDGKGAVIASNGQALHPALAAAADDEETADYPAGGEDWRFATAPIKGTSWRAVIATPHSVLFASVSGPTRWLAWLLLAGYIAVSVFAMVLLRRVSTSRRRLATLNAHLELTMRIDPLTGLTNRRGMEEHLARAISAARRHEHPVAILMVDVDHFKSVNDEHGHAAGDRVLEQLGSVMAGVVRAEDVIGRWGGEEFVAVLPETELAEALALAERLRATVAEARPVLPGGRRLAVTVSIGVSASIDGTLDERLALADAALYEAKAAGRDRVVSARPGSPDRRRDAAGLATGA